MGAVATERTRLAGARASEVVRLLESQGVHGDRLTAVSFGQYMPVVPNDSTESRARNRRIEIRLLPVDGPELGEPVASPAE